MSSTISLTALADAKIAEDQSAVDAKRAEARDDLIAKAIDRINVVTGGGLEIVPIGGATRTVVRAGRSRDFFGKPKLHTDTHGVQILRVNDLEIAARMDLYNYSRDYPRLELVRTCADCGADYDADLHTYTPDDDKTDAQRLESFVAKVAQVLAHPAQCTACKYETRVCECCGQTV